MRKEEAWKKAKGYLYDALSGEEADEIIKALEQEPCEDIKVKKIDEWKIKGKNAELWIVKGNLQVHYLGTIHNIPLSLVTSQAIEQQLTSISGIEDMPSITSEEMQKCKNTIKKYTPKHEPCDVISRERALAPYKDLNDNDVISVRLIKKNIAELPSITPRQKIGRWIYDYTAADGHRTYHCSVCGCYLKPKHSEPLNSFKWCNSCGAKMQAESENEQSSHSEGNLVDGVPSEKSERYNNF